MDDKTKGDSKIDNQRFGSTPRSRNNNNKEVNELHPPSRQDGGVTVNKKSWMLSMMYSKSQDEENRRLYEGKTLAEPLVVKDDDRRSESTSPRISQAEVFDLRREGTVKDIQKKLRNQESLTSPTDSNSRIGDFSGLVNKAKEGLNKSTSRTELKSPTICPSGILDSKRAENDLQWEQLMKTLVRPLKIKDMDFTDLGAEDDVDVFQNGWGNGVANGFPPPPPSSQSTIGLSNGPLTKTGAPPPPPPPTGNIRGPPPPPPPFGGIPPPPFGSRCPPPPPPPSGTIPSPFASRFTSPTLNSSPALNHSNHQQQQNQKVIKKNKKTVKLFWKEVRDDAVIGVDVKTLIWDELKPVNVDTQKLEHLFENRAKDLMSKVRLLHILMEN